jgi:DNA-binding NarL/FixJ family response regulator
MSINVAIVEDNNDSRNELFKIIHNSEELFCREDEVFSNGDDFLKKIKHLKANVVIMDIHLPGKNGTECMEEAKQASPDLLFLMNTVFDDEDNLFEALRLGANGYLLKSDSKYNIVDAIKDVVNPKGGAPMSDTIARKVIKSFKSWEIIKKNKAEEEKLTKREKEVVNLLADGLKYQEIADKLFISKETVRLHIRHIYKKLEVNSRNQVVNKLFPKKSFSK